jgi:flagellar FliL protein
MATQDKPQKEAPAEGGAPKKKRRRLIVIGALALLAGTGGAGWYYLHPPETGAAQATAKPKPAIFLPMESFTVNLLPNEGQLQFLQAGLTLKLEDRDAADLIKEHMPQVRDRVLMVLSSKRSPELLPTLGKQKLATEISDAIRNVIAPATKAAAQTAKPSAPPASPVAAAQAADNPVVAETRVEPKPAQQEPAIEVLFTAFIIQ